MVILDCVIGRVSLCVNLMIFGLIVCSCKAPTPQDDTKVISALSYPFEYPGSPVQIISAHRSGGDIKGYPENCLESIQYISSQIDAWMEIDIRSTVDGHLILMHDPSLERTTNGSGRVEKQSLSVIKKLRLKDNFGNLTDYQIPTLKEVFEWNKSAGVILNLDIKRGVDYNDVLREIESSNMMKKVIAIVYSIDQAKALRRLSNEIVISLPVRSMAEWERLVDSGLKRDKIIAFAGTKKYENRLYETLHENNIAAIFGSMGNIDRQAERRGPRVYKELFDQGVDVISTDRPLEVLSN